LQSDIFTALKQLQKVLHKSLSLNGEKKVMTTEPKHQKEESTQATVDSTIPCIEWFKVIYIEEILAPSDKTKNLIEQVKKTIGPHIITTSKPTNDIYLTITTYKDSLTVNNDRISNSHDLEKVKKYLPQIPFICTVRFISEKAGYVSGSWDNWGKSIQLIYSETIQGYVFETTFLASGTLEFKFHNADKTEYWMSNRYYDVRIKVQSKRKNNEFSPSSTRGHKSLIAIPK